MHTHLVILEPYNAISTPVNVLDLSMLIWKHLVDTLMQKEQGMAQGIKYALIYVKMLKILSVLDIYIYNFWKDTKKKKT